MDKHRYFEGIEEYRLLAKHEVGQNFLVDSDVSQRIVDLLDVQENEKAQAGATHHPHATTPLPASGSILLRGLECQFRNIHSLRQGLQLLKALEHKAEFVKE